MPSARSVGPTSISKKGAKDLAVFEIMSVDYRPEFTMILCDPRNGISRRKAVRLQVVVNSVNGLAQRVRIRKANGCEEVSAMLRPLPIREMLVCSADGDQIFDDRVHASTFSKLAKTNSLLRTAAPKRRGFY